MMLGAHFGSSLLLPLAGACACTIDIVADQAENGQL
jgi:hypothetical protein